MDGNLTDWAAWTGAVVLVLTFIWNVFREFRSGARLSLTITFNCVHTGHGPISSEPFYTMLTVVNTGKLSTGITEFTAVFYKNTLEMIARSLLDFVYRLIKKAGLPLPFKFKGLPAAIIGQPEIGPPLPFELKRDSCEFWCMDQKNFEKIMQSRNSKCTHIVVHYGASKKKKISLKLKDLTS